MTRPTYLAPWATGGGASKTAPGASLESNGWGFGAEAPSDVMNYWQNGVGVWIAYLASLGVHVFDSIEALADALSPGEVGVVREPYADPLVSSAQLDWREAWTATTPGDASRIVCDGVRVYVLHSDRYVRAYNAITGAQEWEYDSTLPTGHDLACDGAYVYLAVGSDVRCLIAATGAVFQTIAVPKFPFAVASDGHAVYVVGRSSGDGLYIYARPTGVDTLLGSVTFAEGGDIQRVSVSKGIVAVARSYDSGGGGAAQALRVYDARDPASISTISTINFSTDDVLDVHGDGERWWIATTGGMYRRALHFKDQAAASITSLHPVGGTTTEDWRAVFATDDQLLAVKTEAANAELSISPTPRGASTSPVWGEVQGVAGDEPFRDICSDTRRAYWCGDNVGSSNTVKALWLPSRPQLYMRASTQDRDRAPFHGVVVPLKGV